MATLTAITPITGRQSESTNIRIIGGNFTIGDNPVLLDKQENQYVLENIIIVSSNIITCNIPNDLESGLYDLRVEDAITNIDAQLDDAFIVIPEEPTYPFTDNYDAIITRMLNRLPDGYDKREGQSFFNILSPVALEVAELKLLAKNATDLTLIQNTTGAYLDFKGLEFGLTRLQPTKAFGTVTLVRDTDFTISSGSLELETNPLEPDNSTTIFVLNQTVVGILIDDNADADDGKYRATDVKIIAQDTGILGNFPVSSINEITTIGYTDISITASSVMVGGADREVDDNFRIRIIRRMFALPRAGNIADYERWCREASDYVGKVQVIPTPSLSSDIAIPVYNTNQSNMQIGGRVHIHFLMRDGTTPGAELITTVQDYIFPVAKNGVAPIGANVKVFTTPFTDIYVDASIISLPGFNETTVVNNVKLALIRYINNLEIGENVSAIKVGNVIFGVAGVNTFNNYTLGIADNPTGTGEITIEINKKPRTDSNKLGIVSA